MVVLWITGILHLKSVNMKISIFQAFFTAVSIFCGSGCPRWWCRAWRMCSTLPPFLEPSSSSVEISGSSRRHHCPTEECLTFIMWGHVWIDIFVMILSQFCFWVDKKNTKKEKKIETGLFIYLFYLNSPARFLSLFSFLLDVKVSVIDGSSPFASAYDLENIIGSYRERNCKLTKTCLLNTNLMNKENLIYLKSWWMYFISRFTEYVYIF